MSIYTVGHSNLELEPFLQALQDNGVEMLVDVRRFPGSRRHPHFRQPELFASLRATGIEPVWREALGGHRIAAKDSVNTGWRVDSFRGYADYMATDIFQTQIDWLLAQTKQVAVMCAESVPWRCHRSLIADAVIARGATVEDIFITPQGRSTRKPHALTAFARVEGDRVWYPSETGELFPPRLDVSRED
ncbi:MAG TPA: DUF488 domain-containing protein [Acidobacteriaceae bacterium]|jgi:uncharacterized protein (DUF488 family)